MGSLMEARRRILLSSPHSVTIQNADIASFSTDMHSPLRALRVAIDPVQDLHGYDSPWPAGGGKNKFNIADVAINEFQTVSGNTITKAYSAYNFDLLNGTTGASSLATKKISLAAGAYTISGAVTSDSSVGVRVYTVDSDGVVAETHLVAINANTPYATFTLSESGYITLRYSTREACTVSNIQIEPGSSATTYAPYSNICPISGWTEANLWRTGKNLLDAETAFADRPTIYSVDDGTINVLVSDGTGWTNITPYPIKAGTYTLTRSNVAGSMDVRLSTENYGIGHTQSGASFTFTMVTDGFIKIKLCFNASDYPLATTVQIELGSTPTPYVPYTGNQFTIQLGQTVYGGYIQVGADGSAELVVTHASKTYSGSVGEPWQKSIYNYFTIGPISDAIDENAKEANFKSNIYPYGNISNNTSMLGACLIWRQVRVRLADMRISVDDWKDMLAAQPMQVVYTLATPITIPLSDITISTLQGQNVMWGDSGKIELLKYWTH